MSRISSLGHANDVPARTAGANAPKRAPLVSVGVFVASFTAFALPISTAATSVGRASMLVCGLALLLALPRDLLSRRLRLHSLAAALCLIALLVLSLAWTVADNASALNALAKYAKLLLIPAMIVLLPTRRDARLALGCFAVAQVFVIVCSIVLGFGIALPWATNSEPLASGAVFTDYITQSIMTVTFGALCWVLRDAFPGRHGRTVGIALAAVAFANTLYFLPGRTGWVIAAALLTLIVWWELPARLRVAALLMPVCLAGLLLLTSGMARDRIGKVVTETDSFVENGVETSSSGERLNFWRRSAQSIAEHPVLGTGVGSWQARYHQLEGGHPPANTRTIRNPHNEYLLIAVQAGVPGALLFVLFLLAMCRDASRFDRATAHSIVLITVSLAVASLFNSALFDGTKGSFFCILAGLLFAYGLGGRAVAFTDDANA